MLIAAVTPEAATHDVMAWLVRHQADDLVISDWTTVEIASALAIKVRVGHLDSNQRTRVHSLLDQWSEESFDVVPVERAVFAAARRYLESTGTGLRSGDALHLAAGEQAGAILVTIDRTLALAARQAGLTVCDPRR